MSTYTKITDFAAKDALLTGNPSKIVKGTEIGAEFDSIASADASNVKGPTSAVTDNAVVRWDTTTGRIAQGSSVTIDDTGNIAGTSFTGALNGTVGATTPATGAFTTLSASGNGSFGTSATGANVLSVDGAGSGTGAGALVAVKNAGVNDILIGNKSAILGGAYDSTALVYSAGPIKIYGAATDIATFSSTGLAVTGALSATGQITTSNVAGNTIFEASTATTNAKPIRIANTGGNVYFGVEGSAGGAFLTGATAYSFAINNVANTPIHFATNNTLQATLDTSGNLGLGVTPSAWGSGYKALEFPGGAVSSIGASITRWWQNAYYNGTNYIYKATSAATMFEQSSGAFNWYAAPSGTAGTTLSWTVPMTLDTSGNLGLGVTPSAWGTAFKALQVGTTAAFRGRPGVEAAGMSSNWYYTAGAVDTYIANGFATDYRQSSGTHAWYTAPSGTAGNAIPFTQAMTLDAFNNLMVGTTTAGLHNSNSHVLNTSGNAFQVVNHISGTASGVAYASFGYNGGAIGSITQNGTTAVAFNTTSDHRLKLNVRDANAARFMDIQFRDFEWVDGRHDCGVIAHELQAVYPDLVMGAKDATEVRTVEITPAVPEVKDADGNVVTPAVPAVTEQQTFPVYQQVNYIGLICRMGTRIQQQQRLIDAQAAALAAIEARLAAAGL